jgi:hypothetical protein
VAAMTMRSQERNSAYPYVDGVLKSIGLYGSDGSFISGKNLRSTSIIVAAGVIAAETLRLVVSATARNPSIASAFIPVPDLKGLTINLNAVGLTSQQVKEFMNESVDQQKQECTKTPGYVIICPSLISTLLLLKATAPRLCGQTSLIRRSTQLRIRQSANHFWLYLAHDLLGGPPPPLKFNLLSWCYRDSAMATPNKGS